MKYCRFGRLDWEVSLLGISAMGLAGNAPGNHDKSQSVELIRYAIEQGVNYVSLGHPYDRTQHERRTRLVGQALEGEYRNKVRLAAMLPVSQVSSRDDFDRCLDDQLAWLGGGQIDFCLLGTLTRDNWPSVSDLGVLSWAERAMADGRISKLGFSFHDHFQILRSILKAYDQWAVCEFQYSYMDVDHDPGISGIKYAADQGLAVVITEPLRSGQLTQQLPDSVRTLWDTARPLRSLSEWGLRFVWNDAEVSTVVVDMTTREQVTDYAAIAASAEPDALGVSELLLFAQVRDAYRKLRPINCPSCRACMPCPIGIDVPRIFELYNDAMIYNVPETGRALYADEQHQAETCTQCGLCVSKCAKSIPILDWLAPAHELLGPKAKGR